MHTGPVSAVLVFLLTLLPCTLQAQPRTGEEFVAAVRTALREKNPEKFHALFYTAGLSESDQKRTKAIQQRRLEGGEVESITLEPLPEEFRAVFVAGGQKIEPSYAPTGFLKINYKANSTAQVMMPPSEVYGIMNGQYYLLATRTTELAWKGPPDKTIGFAIVGQGAAYTKAKWNTSGVDLEQVFHVSSTTFSGQYIEQVTVTSTSEEADVTLVVLEDGKQIFASEPLTGKGTVEYKRKH